MDPLSLAGTLIGLIQTCNSIVSLCYEYHQGVKDARQDICQILDEVTSVRNITERLVKISISDNASDLVSLQSVSGPGSSLRKCLEELVALQDSLKLGKLGHLKWPFRKPDAEKRLQTIGRIKATLQLALATDNAQNLAEVLIHARTIPHIQKQVSSLAEDREDQKRIEFLRWLGEHHQSSKQEDELRKASQGTGTYLLQNETYVTWRKQPGLLWVNGQAGCGKTVLCAKMIENLQMHCKGNADVGLCYFYIDGSAQMSIDVESLYKSLVVQLATQRRALPKFLADFLDNYGPGSYRSRRSTTLKPWHDIFRRLLGEFEEAYVVFDALDECGEVELDEVVKLVSQSLSTAHTKLHIAVFSRELERIRSKVQILDANSILVGGEALDDDLQTALSYQLSSHPKFIKWPATLKKSVESSLLERTHGSFRWLDCQLQELVKCGTPAAVRKVLGNLPESLEIYYARVLESVHKTNRMSVQNLLRWVCFSFRSLSVIELASAISINAEDAELPFIDEDLELLDVDHFMDSCSSFISTYYAMDANGSPKCFVKLAHFSVREFLVSNALRDQPLSGFALEEKLAHSCLAQSCLVYFQEAVRSAPDDLWIAYPLATYTAYHWLEHGKRASQDWSPTSLHTVLLDMFDERKAYFRSWLKVAVVDRPWEDEDTYKKPDYTPLYCAAYLGFGGVVSALLDKGAQPDLRSGIHGTALQAAAFKGHLSVVNILLHVGASPNEAGGTHNSALAAAAAQGHHEIVQELIQAEAKANPKFDDGRSDPLFLAAKNGHLAVCKLLLDHGARDIFRMKKWPGSALHAAAIGGQFDIVKELLKHKQVRSANQHRMSRIIRPAEGGMSASQHSAASLGYIDILRELTSYGISNDEVLRYAAAAGDKELVIESLEKGADINDEGSVSDHPRPLESAARNGHVSMFKDLLLRGADPNASTYGVPAAMTSAIEGGSLEIVQLLLDAGVKVDSPVFLNTATSARLRDISELLVKHGANTHIPLRTAAVEGDDTKFMLLVKLGADIHQQEPDDETSMMQAAACGGNTVIVQYLFENGLMLDPPVGCKETTPLMEAIRSQNWSVAHFLLENGADLNASPPVQAKPSPRGSGYVNGKRWPPEHAYETALTMTISRKMQKFAWVLMDHGAMTTPDQPPTAGTPLLYAIWEDFTDLIKELLKRGADPKQRGTILERGNPTFPLLLAAEKGNVEVINNLISAGAMVDDQDNEGFSPMHVAAASDDFNTLQALINDHHAKLDLGLLNGSRPIHSAAARGTVNNLRILLDAGAPINDKNNTGRTPLHWAADSGNWDTVEFLLDRGADVKIKAEESGANTVLDMAYLAKDKPVWDRNQRVRETWSDERVDGLLLRLKEATKV